LRVPDTPPRLDFVFQRYDPPLFFVTFNTHNRRKLLANVCVHRRFVEFAQKGQERGVAVGRYVIMPDHIHLFISGRQELLLTQWVRLLKRSLSKVITSPPPHWQKGFFDHLIRHGESYAEKWEYVRQNPLRGELVSNYEDWPWKARLSGSTSKTWIAKNLCRVEVPSTMRSKIL
jgi:REP element-mobilizing transposase RayT